AGGGAEGWGGAGGGGGGGEGGGGAARRYAHAITIDQRDLNVAVRVVHDMNRRQCHWPRAPPPPDGAILARQPLPPVIQHPRRHAMLLRKRARLRSARLPATGEVKHLGSTIVLCL